MAINIVSALLLIGVLVPSGLGDIFELPVPVGNYPSRPQYRSSAISSNTCQVRKIFCPTVEVHRTMDGSCNNIQHPEWGASETPLARLLPAQYDDGLGLPRTQSNRGLKLPSTRFVSNVLKESAKKESTKISHMHVLWGQLMAHDIVHTPVIKKPDNKPIDCNCANPDPNCFNIQLPKNDEQTVSIGKTCMPIERSKAAIGINCKFAYRQQLTTMSAVIDATMLYGKNDKELSELTDAASAEGYLYARKNPVSSRSAYKLLPTQDMMHGAGIANSTDCKKLVHKPKNIPCFVGGDVRNNENTGLSSIQTVLLRYHQIIARRLYQLNPLWRSKKIVYTTRDIISAILQRITYKDYLMPLVGPKFMKRYDLNLLDDGYWNGYDSTHNPSISNSFTTAAFRYGHSQVATTLSRPGPYFDRSKHAPIPSRNSFFNGEPLLVKTGGGVGSIIRGFMMDKAESTDTTIIDDMRNQLFTKFHEKYGNDLFAINVQRGRDHGLPPYNEYRQLCGLTKARTFQDLSKEIPYSKINKLKSVYDSVEDIDLYVGGLSETAMKDAEVGPTFACLLSHQFRAIRRGDRYWHENKKSPNVMTKTQLQAIRDLTLSRILCETGEDMRYVSPKPLQIATTSIIRCDSLKELDLKPWADVPYARSDNFETGKQVASEWSLWFPTNQPYGPNLNAQQIIDVINYKRKDEICNGILSHQIRKMPYDSNTQIRFLCPAGEIKATDFPHQVSDKNYYTPWILTKELAYGAGYTVGIQDFECTSPIGIQAHTLKGVFVREMEYVLEDYNVRNGFTCRHTHQESGVCPEFYVRVLCPREKIAHKPLPQPSYRPVTTEFNPIPPPITPPTGLIIPPAVIETASYYCNTFGICCKTPFPFYTFRNIPSIVRSETRSFCDNYNLCCPFSFSQFS